MKFCKLEIPIFAVVPLPSATCPTAAAAASKLLVISGGDGYEDFSSGANSDMVGRDDSTNHLLLWQV